MVFRLLIKNITVGFREKHESVEAETNKLFVYFINIFKTCYFSGEYFR